MVEIDCFEILRDWICVKSGSSYIENTPVEYPIARRLVPGWNEAAVTFAFGWRKKCFESIRQRISADGEDSSSTPSAG
jgi:hypothetical protein